MSEIKRHLFYVSRQHYYYSKQSTVEVAQGGLDYAGSDMLSTKYRGEGQEYIGMTTAMEAAIIIARQWKRDQKALPKDKRVVVHIVHGCTGGMLTEMDGGQPFTEKVARELLHEADKYDEELPRCARCGEIITGERYGNDHTTHMGGDESYPFCSENCADNDYYEQEAELRKAIEEEEGASDDETEE